MLLPFLVLGTAYGATPQSTTNLNQTKNNSFVDNLGFNMELTTELAQDRNTRDVVGTNNFFEANLSYRIDGKNNINLANGWTGRYRENEDAQTSYDYVQLEYNRKKILTYEENGIDLRLHVRGSYTTNADLRDMYGSYGLAETRLYFGRPLIGNLSINKYISYVRLQKYFVKDDAPKARSFGWRTMISPSYQIARNFDASFIITYSGYRLNNNDLDEELEVNPSIRYQMGKLALIVGAEFKPYDTKNGAFKFIEGFESTPTYSTILTFYAF